MINTPFQGEGEDDGSMTDSGSAERFEPKMKGWPEAEQMKW